MIIITGGAGFIGSNLVKALNEKGRRDILIVDNLTDGTKFKNLADCDIADYLDKTTFLEKIQNNYNFGNIEGILHQGACSVTTEWNGRYMMENNYAYSKVLLHYCLARKISFIYASSASVYGAGTTFIEEKRYEKPLNVYGYSKFLFDQYVRNLTNVESQIVGLRYFNVYGPREHHKGSMASVAFHFNNQILKDGVVKLFEGCDGYGNGEQQRDFIYVGDVAAVNLWFLANPTKTGIFNLGTGRSESFNAVANAVINFHQHGQIEYIPFPENLRSRYQSFTEANMSKLKAAGYTNKFKIVAEGVSEYLSWLKSINA